MNTYKLRRPQLNKIDLKEATEKMLSGKLGLMDSQFYITMSVGQWDSFLDAGYFHNNATVIEVDNSGKYIAAYKHVK